MDAAAIFLTFEVDAESEQLFIHADPAGLRRLARRLEALAARVEQRGPDHDHFFSEEWGPDGDLSSQPQSAGAWVIHHVKVLGWSSTSNEPADKRTV